MSDTESFIEEVSEEVRRDRLFRLMRRYGWIAILLVVLLVGGAAYNEWRKARDIAAAQAVGDSLITALSADESEARAEALSELEVEGDASAVLGLVQAAEAQNADDPAAAVAALDQIVTDSGLPQVYRDLAVLKRVIVQADSASVEDRRAALEGIAAPGAPFRLLAEEQLALLDLEGGDAEAAITRLQSILVDTEVTAGLRNRVSQLIVALGGEPEAG
ncbi:hypothetical protein [Aliiroseovarius sp. YM-037]|uniref:hypothetical protein n=1 Tax=Aliiroseovarius sp. YM-037 TaxID=3341728 RepID=UPI003A7FB1C2